jgi:hypothetical protein
MTSGRLGVKRALGVGIATLVLLASGAVAANVSSLATVLPAGVELPSVPVQIPTVAVPTVPVKTPTVPVKAPTVPVKAPTVPVRMPTVPVKTPTVAVKTPTVPVKTPTVPVKAPTGNGTVPSKGASGSPSQTTAPKIPSISAGTPSVPSTISSAAGRIGTKDSGSVVAAPHGSVGAGTVGSPGGEPVTGVAGYPMGASASGPSGNSSPSLGYGTFPEPPGVARILAQEGDRALDNREIRELVLSLRGCLSSLPHQLRAVLELRTGVGRTQAMDAGSVASHLGISRQRVLMLEPVALKRLRSAGKKHNCAVPGTELAGQVLASYLSISPGQGTDAGGVDGALYFKAPAGSGTSLPVATGTADKTDALHAVRPGSPLFWTLLVALAGLLLIGFLFVDNLGIGRRHRPRGWRRT